jgi:hypothetical protein
VERGRVDGDRLRPDGPDKRVGRKAEVTTIFTLLPGAANPAAVAKFVLDNAYTTNIFFYGNPVGAYLLFLMVADRAGFDGKMAIGYTALAGLSGVRLVDRIDIATPENHREHFGCVRLRRRPRGTRTPLGSHIRRVNPRDALDSTATDARLHRLLRRGAAYGPMLTEGVLDDDGASRGLMLTFVNADPARQFEFVQSPRSFVISRRSARLLRPQAVQTQAEHLQEDAAVLCVRRVLGDRARRAGVLDCVSCVGGEAARRPLVVLPAAVNRHVPAHRRPSRVGEGASTSDVTSALPSPVSQVTGVGGRERRRLSTTSTYPRQS